MQFTVQDNQQMLPVKIQKLKNHPGFTLVELLIVVVIVSALAAVVVPQFSDTVNSSNTAAVRQNNRILQNAIDRYHADHGFYPGINTSGMGCSNNSRNYGAGGESVFFLRNRLTLYTNAEGRMCDKREDSAGVRYPLGPYISKDIPINPINGIRQVYISAAEPAATKNLSGYGWVYSYDTGTVRPATD